MVRVRTPVLVSMLVLSLLWAPGGAVGAVGAVAAQECTFPVTETDATGTAVTVAEEPQRIVTLNPSAAQTMWEIGGREKVVGLSKFAFYLEGARNRTNIWAGQAVNFEAVVGLQPDLVLAPNTIDNRTVERLRDAGLTVFRFDRAVSVEFIYRKTRLIGRLTGECSGARAAVSEMRHEVEIIRTAVEGTERPRALYTFFGFTAGTDTFVHEIITTAGGRNVAAEAGIEGFRKLNEEVVVARDPEWLILNSDNPTVPDSEAYNSTTAVRENNVVVLDANYISQPAPRIVRPIRELTRAMHPRAYEQAAERLEGGGGGPLFSLSPVKENGTVIERGRPATFALNVSNAGETGSLVAYLYVGGSAKSSKLVRVESGETRTVRFRHTFARTGTYDVAINGRSLGSVRVVDDLSIRATTTPTPTPDSETPTATPSRTAGSTGTTATATPPPAAGPTTDARAQDTEPPATTAPATGTPSVTAAATPASTGGQPGFGIVAVLLALVAAGLLARRRG